MRLLHGSNVAVKKPDLKWCQSKNDFGRGFYLTPSLEAVTYSIASAPKKH